jgi:hypothetical protein
MQTNALQSWLKLLYWLRLRPLLLSKGSGSPAGRLLAVLDHGGHSVFASGNPCAVSAETCAAS